MTDPALLVVDIETLGYEPTDALIELGWVTVSFDPASGDWVTGAGPHGEQLFGLAGQEMKPDNRAVHHISPDDLYGLRSFDRDYMMDLADGFALQGITHAVAHNSAFEDKWLDLGVPWICTYKCALHAWPDAPSHSNQALKYFLGIADHPIFHPPHRARPDAEVTAQILRRLLQLHPIELLEEWTLQPKPVLTLPFGKHKGMLIAEVPGDYLDWVAGPKCDNADPDLKYACNKELERRRADNSPLAVLKENLT